ncbi:hypothetical protein HYPDE_37238 [Hyphomicrobium denitrificans 1NES1]|uniref:Uncharacterized protein n=1 Tax=Hyphomicrobium denitrificans 1NES1 TaxID=670307 RepID=N0B6B6_9HYPH|nr:hypothetical protein HYPDE_37238 [Hyphomicrobium denitrificans 1NES1]
MSLILVSRQVPQGSFADGRPERTLLEQLLARGVVFATRSAASGLFAAFQVGPQDFREALGTRFLG